jgi:hypothetical protein
MSVFTSAGTTIGIVAGAPTTYDATGYTALTFVPIGEVTDLGEFGREYALVTHNPVANRGTVKKKGSFNEGSITLQLGLDTDDAGQILAKTASNSDADYSFAVTTQNGDKYFFRAQVMSFKVSVGGVDTITNATIMLEITTNSAGVGIVEKLAP